MSRRNPVKYTHDGKTLTVREWATLAGVPHITLRNRLRVRCSIAEAITFARTAPAAPQPAATVDISAAFAAWARLPVLRAALVICLMSIAACARSQHFDDWRGTDVEAAQLCITNGYGWFRYEGTEMICTLEGYGDSYNARQTIAEFEQQHGGPRP